jgi:DNA-binding transcriptional MerR regulator
MDKSPEAFRTISEVADEMDLPQHVLRFWETRFPQIRPLKRGGGRRYYRPADIELLRAIKDLLYGEGYTIRGVQKLLREQGASGLVGSAARAARASGTAPGLEPAPPRGEEARAEAEDLGAKPEPSRALATPAADLATLRAIQTDLREAERILVQARAPSA